MNVSFPFIPCLLPDAWLRRIGEMFLESLRGRSWPLRRKLALSHGEWGKARQMSAPLALHWHGTPVTYIFIGPLPSSHNWRQPHKSRANKCKANLVQKNYSMKCYSRVLLPPPCTPHFLSCIQLLPYGLSFIPLGTNIHACLSRGQQYPIFWLVSIQHDKGKMGRNTQAKWHQLGWRFNDETLPSVALR